MLEQVQKSFCHSSIIQLIVSCVLLHVCIIVYLNIALINLNKWPCIQGFYFYIFDLTQVIKLLLSTLRV